jgi:hypothetical protein
MEHYKVEFIENQTTGEETYKLKFNGNPENLAVATVEMMIQDERFREMILVAAMSYEQVSK